VGKGSQDNFNDAKNRLEPEMEVARPARTLKRHVLGQALQAIFDTFAPGKWTSNKTMRNFFNTIYRPCVYTVDGSHLIREFRSFADCTPRHLAASAPPYFELRQNEDWCDFMKQYFNLSYSG
jgi:hypothetical protein